MLTLRHPGRLASAQSQYQTLELKGRLDGAGPHQLVTILYEELQRALDVLCAAAARGHGVASHPQVLRARSILIALETGLDFRSGQELSRSLAGVYRAMRRELADAAREGDRQKLGAIGEGVRSIAAAWAAIVN